MPFTTGDPSINREGRPKGSGISITTEIKNKLKDIPDNQKKSYLELLIDRIMKQAIADGDQQMIKQIWNYVDGMPKQSIEHTGSVPVTDILSKDNAEESHSNKEESGESSTDREQA